LERVRQAARCAGAGLVSTGLPGTGFHGDDSFSIQKIRPSLRGKLLARRFVYVDPEFFHALQIALIRRANLSTPGTLEQAQIVVVNEALRLRRFFPGRDPIGKQLWDNNDGPQNRYEIVALPAILWRSVAENPKPTMYYPLYRGGKPYVYMAGAFRPGSIKPRAAHSADDFQDRSRPATVRCNDHGSVDRKQTTGAKLNATLS